MDRQIANSFSVRISIVLFAIMLLLLDCLLTSSSLSQSQDILNIAVIDFLYVGKTNHPKEVEKDVLKPGIDQALNLIKLSNYAFTFQRVNNGTVRIDYTLRQALKLLQARNVGFDIAVWGHVTPQEGMNYDLWLMAFTNPQKHRWCIFYYDLQIRDGRIVRWNNEKLDIPESAIGLIPGAICGKLACYISQPRVLPALNKDIEKQIGPIIGGIPTSVVLGWHPKQDCDSSGDWGALELNLSDESQLTFPLPAAITRIIGANKNRGLRYHWNVTVPSPPVADLRASTAIIGKVVADSEPLVGVNVFLQGSVRGASTNYDGKYRIRDIAPGKYTLVFSIIGYQREIRSNVAVEEGKETVVNVAMTVAPVQTDQVVVTANKREQSLQEVPVSISVMDAAEMKYRNSVTLEDAVRYVPGVNLTGGQINIRGSSGYSRGAGSRVLMLIDGVPFVAGDTGELVFESIPVGQVERIEVVKGASSALYGSNALGGVVNVITKSIPEVPETDIRTFGGMYNRPSHLQWQWSTKDRFFNGVSFGHARKFGDLGIALFGSRQTDDGFRRNDYRRRFNLFLKGKNDFSATNSLTVSFGFLHQYGGQFQYWADVDSALIPPYQQRDDAVKSTRYFTSALYSDAIANNFLLSVKGIWNHNNWFSTSVHDFSGEGWQLLPSGRYAETLESLADGFRLDASATWIADDQHTVTFGINGQFDKVVADRKLFGKHTGWGAALFGQDEWKLTNQFLLTLGARFDVQSVGLLESGPQFNPKLAVSYIPVDGTTLRASFGRGFRIPAVAEIFVTLDLGGGFTTLPNTGLKPELSYSYEVGVSQHLSDFGTVDLAAFRSDYNNLIDPQITSSGVQWRNTPKARVQGVETSLKLGLFNGGLLYNLGYTYVYPEDLSPQDPLLPRPNNILPYRPRHLLYTGVLGRLGMFRAGVDFRYISKVDRVFSLLNSFINDIEERAKIVVVDFRFGADFSSLGIPLSATMNINNAFRYNYLELTANMSPPRNFVFVLETKL